MSDRGWTRFRAYVLESWGPLGYARQIDRAIAKARSSGAPAERDICEIAFANRVVHALMQWPEKRLAEIRERQALAASPCPRYTRGGY